MTFSLQCFSPLTLSSLCLRKSSSFKGATCWLRFCAWMWNAKRAHRTPKRRRSLDIMLGTHEVSQLHTPKFLRWTGLIESQLGETFRLFFCICSKPSLRLLWLSCDKLCTEFSPSLREFGCESNLDTSTTCTRPLQSRKFEERIFKTLGFVFSQ